MVSAERHSVRGPRWELARKRPDFFGLRYLQCLSLGITYCGEGNNSSGQPTANNVLRLVSEVMCTVNNWI